MRTIKFRGFSTDSNQWVYGFYREYPIYQRCGTCLDHINYFIDLVGGGSEFVKPETVGQFTGLFDKNGNEIYEGDIVQTTTRIGIVEIKNCSLSVNDHNPETKNDCSYPHKSWVVLGNIHDNPELLKTE